jgi:hypothetical protein
MSCSPVLRFDAGYVPAIVAIVRGSPDRAVHAKVETDAANNQGSVLADGSEIADFAPRRHEAGAQITWILAPCQNKRQAAGNLARSPGRRAV